jgi:OOP family OmpA-OmpF porin
MKHVAKSLLAAGVAAVCCAAAPAHAQLQFGRMDTSLYLGASVGASKFRESCDGIPAGLSCDNKDVAWKVFAGYMFTPYVGIEGGYVDMGKATLSGPGLSAEAKARGVELVGVVSFPITEQFAVYGKLGAIRSKVRVSATAVGPGFAATGSNSDTSTDFTFGLGAKYFITRNFAARLEWQRYQNVGGNNTGTDDVDTFNAGLLYAF